MVVIASRTVGHVLLFVPASKLRLLQPLQHKLVFYDKFFLQTWTARNYTLIFHLAMSKPAQVVAYGRKSLEAASYGLSRCTVSMENAGRQTAMYSAPPSWGVE
jgi:hypothetical protein